MKAIRCLFILFVCALWAAPPLSAQCFQESGGELVIEAENYSSLSAALGTNWELEIADNSDSGNSMKVNNGTASPNNTQGNTTGPRMDYDVVFNEAGIYNFWIRTKAQGGSGGNNSVHLGVEGSCLTCSTGSGIGQSSSSWSWTQNIDGGNQTAITYNVTNAQLGIPITINVWMREDGVHIDKLVLRKNGAVVSGNGPAESASATCSGSGGSGNCEVVVHARGNCGGEEVELQIGNTTVSTYTMTTSFADYTYSGFSGTEEIKVVFVNDANNGCDRNVYVDYISVDGTVLQTETEATRTGCGNDQWLWCNGNFNFGSQSCSGGGGGPTNTLLVSPNSLSFGNGAGSQTVSISSNVSWSVSNNQAWISLSASNGTNNGSLNVNVQENTTTSTRTGTVTVNSGGLSQTVTVTQAAASTGGGGGSCATSGLIALYDFSAGSGNTVSDQSGVSPATNLTIENPANVSWLSNGLRLDAATRLSGDGNKIRSELQSANAFTLEAWVTPANNTQTGPARIMTLSGSGGERNFTVGAQGNKYVMRLRTSSPNFSNNGIPQTQAPNGTVTTAKTHIVVTRETGGNLVIYVNGVAQVNNTVDGNLNNWDSAYDFALGNEFNADRAWLGTYHRVALYDRALSAQEVDDNYAAGSACDDGSGGGGPTNNLSVNPGSLSFGSGAGNQNFSVSSNVNWSVSDNQGWISVSPTSGSDNGNVMVSVQANSNTSSRNGTVTISGGGLSQTVSINQDAATANELTVSPNTVSFTAAGGSQSVSVSGNVSWSVSNNQGWISTSPNSGSNNGSVSITAVENTSTNPRSGTVTFIGGGLTRTVSVSQDAASGGGGTGDCATNGLIALYLSLIHI